ncbi:MAG: TIGR00269 family protein, partial [Thermoplasmata archaeon]
AKKNRVDYLATGLNLDDTAQSIVMNIARGDISRLARMGPHKTVKEGLIPRIQPLITIPEREVLIYAILNNIEFYHGECPYALSAVRNEFRDAIDTWELRTPGTKHAILNSYNAIKNVLADKYSIPLLNACERCGEPTVGKICKACELLDSLKIYQ